MRNRAVLGTALVGSGRQAHGALLCPTAAHPSLQEALRQMLRLPRRRRLLLLLTLELRERRHRQGKHRAHGHTGSQKPRNQESQPESMFWTLYPASPPTITRMLSHRLNSTRPARADEPGQGL